MLFLSRQLCLRLRGMLIASFVSQFRFFCFASFISYFNLVFKTVTIMRTLLHFLNSYFITISKIRIEINALFRVLCNKNDILGFKIYVIIVTPATYVRN